MNSISTSSPLEYFDSVSEQGIGFLRLRGCDRQDRRVKIALNMIKEQSNNSTPIASGCLKSYALSSVRDEKVR